MLSVVKKIRVYQIACILCMIAMVVIYFMNTAKPVILSLDDIINSENQTIMLNGKEAPIEKADISIDYPADVKGYQLYMLLQPPLRTVKIDGVTVPLGASKWGISKKSKIPVEVIAVDDEMKSKIGLTEYYNKNPEMKYADYILIEKPAWLLRVLVFAVAFLGWRLIRLGTQRQREYANH